VWRTGLANVSLATAAPDVAPEFLNKLNGEIRTSNEIHAPRRRDAQMTTLGWIVASGLAMTAIALVGGFALLLHPDRLQRILLPLVAFAAGTLLGGALLHMLPGAIDHLGSRASVFVWVLAGFVVFFALEQFLHWHHSHRAIPGVRPQPLTYLVLLGDGLHNFLGGLAVAAAFIADVRLGLGAWLAAAAHEVPQELGDFAVLVHGGWSPRRALTFNVISASTFLLGGLVAYAISARLNLFFLLPFAAGNFLYIAASDLVPEVKHDHGIRDNAIHLFAMISGVALLYLLRVVLE
jgi:zinc and cadmium transporter